MKEKVSYSIAWILLTIIGIIATIIILPKKIKDLFYLIGSCTKAGTR